jgi:hypothetical protein
MIIVDEAARLRRAGALLAAQPVAVVVLPGEAPEPWELPAAYSGHRQYPKSDRVQIGRTPLIVRNKKSPRRKPGAFFIRQDSAYRLT